MGSDSLGLLGPFSPRTCEPKRSRGGRNVRSNNSESLELNPLERQFRGMFGGGLRGGSLVGRPGGAGPAAPPPSRRLGRAPPPALPPSRLPPFPPLSPSPARPRPRGAGAAARARAARSGRREGSRVRRPAAPARPQTRTPAGPGRGRDRAQARTRRPAREESQGAD